MNYFKPQGKASRSLPRCHKVTNMPILELPIKKTVISKNHQNHENPSSHRANYCPLLGLTIHLRPQSKEPYIRKLLKHPH